MPPAAKAKHAIEDLTTSYSADEWKEKRPLITRLYHEERKTLREVRTILEQNYGFTPTERMYKSRLHQWGLDKKKKEHEMLDIIRAGLKQRSGSKDVSMQIRGRKVTYEDAMHYFSRKGIRNPESLLDNVESPASDNTCVTPTGDASDMGTISIYPDEERTASPTRTEPMDLDVTDWTPPSSPPESPPDAQDLRSLVVAKQGPLVLAERPLRIKSRQVDCFAPMSLSPSSNSNKNGTPIKLSSPTLIISNLPFLSTMPRRDEHRYRMEVLVHARDYYNSIFSSSDRSENSMLWSATSADSLADKFFFAMFHGYASLWNNQHQIAFEEMDYAFGLIKKLLEERHVGFMIYVYDLVIRLEGGNLQPICNRLLKYVAEMTVAVFSEHHPISKIANSFLDSTDRKNLAEVALRKMLEFFQDSLGYFHQETIAVLQTYASSLLNLEWYEQAIMRYQQLLSAFETTKGHNSYEACYTLRVMSECYYYQDNFESALTILNDCMGRSEGLLSQQKAEIQARCYRAMAEVANRQGRYDEALNLMFQIVVMLRLEFGDNHTFTRRSLMHYDSLTQKPTGPVTTIPPIIHRLGKGGDAAMFIWTSRTHLPLK